MSDVLTEAAEELASLQAAVLLPPTEKSDEVLYQALRF
jgi:hypothetical protein